MTTETSQGDFRTRIRKIWGWLKIVGIVAGGLLALIGAGTVYAKFQPEPQIDLYAQARMVSQLTVDVVQEGQPPDGLPDLFVVVTRVVGISENVDDGTLTLRIEGVTVPPLP